MDSTRQQTLFLSINPNQPEPQLIARAAAVLRDGGVGIVPTDTVYGLGLRVSDYTTPDLLYQIKQRDADKAIPLLIASSTDLLRLSTDLPPYALDLAQRHWPGSLTLIVRASASVPSAFCASDGSVALRVPNSPVALALITALDAPLATSSANQQGLPPACSVDELDPLVAAQATLIVDAGKTPVGQPSTIVSCLAIEPVILRQGLLSSAALW